jgi:hypothetical protein
MRWLPKGAFVIRSVHEVEGADALLRERNRGLEVERAAQPIRTER